MIGRRIQTIRNRRHMTQQTLAEISNLSVPYISHIENGRKNVSLSALVRIAAALEVTVDQLLVGNQLQDQDSLHIEIQDIFSDCTLREQRMLVAVAEAVKNILRTLE